MRDFIISTYEKLLYLVVIFAVISGFLMGYRLNAYEPSVFSGLIGAGIGFLGSVTVIGLLLTIISIKESIDAARQDISQIRIAVEDVRYRYKQSLDKQN